MKSVEYSESINYKDYFDIDTLHNKLEFLLKFADLAPSRNNTRPWKFEVEGEQIRIYADFSKRLDYTDPYNRELYISLGCVLANLEIAAEFYGLNYSTYIFTGESINNLVSVTNFSTTKPPTYAYPVPLFHCITRRHINRNFFTSKPIEDEFLRYIGNSINWIEGIYLYITNNKDVIDYLAELSSEAEEEQFDNPALRKEQLNWIQTNEHSEGVPVSSLHLSQLSSVMLTVNRSYNFGKDKAHFDNELLKHAPYIGILLSEKEEKTDWITTGIAFQVLALRMTSLGVAYHPMTSGLEVPYIRDKVQDLVESTKIPQVLFRFGYTKDSPQLSKTPPSTTS